jgi:hypothetical protein
MFIQQKLMVSLALVLSTASASAGTLVYVITGANQFGTVDLGTGSFQQIGPGTDPLDSLVPGPNGNLLSLSIFGDLESINPATGVSSVIGATGLGDVAGFLAKVGGTVYATDLNSNLYTIDPTTGASTLVGLTGLPAVPFVPGSINPDGSINLFDETFYGVGGSLYATFDAVTIDPVTFAATPLIDPALYQIDPATGFTTLVASTLLNLDASVQVGGVFYAFPGVVDGSGVPFGSLSYVYTLDLTNGNTSYVSAVDPSVPVIFGASPTPTPEPASVALAGIGIAAIIVSRRRRRRL